MLPKKFLLAFALCLPLLSGCTTPFTNSVTTPAALTALSQPQAEVYLDNQDMGPTPITKKEIKPGTYQVTVRTAQATWSKFIRFYAGTDTYIDRTFAADNSSTGSVVTLEQGTGLAILGSPENAQITLDTASIGAIPIYVPHVSAGTHTLAISAPSYANTTQQLTINPAYKIIVNVDLAKSGTAAASLTPQPTASTIPIASGTTVPSSGTATVASPVGWVRVRAQASVNSQELTRVNNGDVLVILDKQPGWLQVKTAEGKIGWVSADYVTTQ